MTGPVVLDYGVEQELWHLGRLTAACSTGDDCDIIG